jgi:hypothetical protein
MIFSLERTYKKELRHPGGRQTNVLFSDVRHPERRRTVISSTRQRSIEPKSKDLVGESEKLGVTNDLYVAKPACPSRANAIEIGAMRSEKRSKVLRLRSGEAAPGKGSFSPRSAQDHGALVGTLPWSAGA